MNRGPDQIASRTEAPTGSTIAEGPAERVRVSGPSDGASAQDGSRHDDWHVDEAGRGSFAASDPPAWWAGAGHRHDLDQTELTVQRRSERRRE